MASPGRAYGLPSWSGAARRSVAYRSSMADRVMLARRGESTPPCGVPASVRSERTFGQHPRLQEGSDESAHLRVRDPPAKARHDMVVIDVVEAALDVPFDDPLIGRTGPIGFGLHADRADRVADMLQSIATRPASDGSRTRRAGTPPRRSAPAVAGARPERRDPAPSAPRAAGTCPACRASGSSRA